jgi:AcrR family transcriptional regulator
MLQDKLLDAAVEHFGEYGFDGASTRAIARASGTAMSSITYHFGGKEGLYLAAADHIAGLIREKQLETMPDALAGAIPATLTREEATARLLAMLDGFASLMLDPASASWCKFIVREQQQPTAAFERLYQGFMHVVVESALALTRLARPDLGDAQARALAVMLYGQCLVMRVGRASVTRALGVADLGPDEALLLRQQLRQNSECILKGNGP